MNFKTITGALLGASLAIVPAETAKADAGDFIAGAIIGGIVGAGIGEAASQSKRCKYTNTHTGEVWKDACPADWEHEKKKAKRAHMSQHGHYYYKH